MKIVRNINELRKELFLNREKSVGFVPTMGFLHKGHCSLITKSKQDNQVTIVSIFVNPLQFGPKEDFSKYPRDENKDIILCKNLEVDILFLPEVDELIGNIYSHVNIEFLDSNLCGRKRIGHYKGVCTIVSKLFNIVQPNNAYFGKKDIQQLIIIKRMVKDLNFPIEIIGCDTIRDNDHLALSSRNSYLSKEERQAAQIVPNVLNYIKDIIYKKNIYQVSILYELSCNFIKKELLATIDYIEFVDENLQSIDKIKNNSIIAVAIYIGNTRLIDNILINF